VAGAGSWTGQDESLLVALDWRPTLTAAQSALAAAAAAVLTCAVYAYTAPAALSIAYGTCIGLVFGLLLVLVRYGMLENQYKVRPAAPAPASTPHPCASAGSRRTAWLVAHRPSPSPHDG
jgi:hypothetical protein